MGKNANLRRRHLLLQALLERKPRGGENGKKNLRNHQSGIFLGSLTANDDAALTANGRRTTNLSFPPPPPPVIVIHLSFLPHPLVSFLCFGPGGNKGENRAAEAMHNSGGLQMVSCYFCRL